MRFLPIVAFLVVGTPAVHGGEPKQVVNTLGMKLVPIPMGEFLMGQGDAPPKSRAEFLERDFKRWGPVVKAAGMKVD